MVIRWAIYIILFFRVFWTNFFYLAPTNKVRENQSFPSVQLITSRIDGNGNQLMLSLLKGLATVVGGSSKREALEFRTVEMREGRMTSCRVDEGPETPRAYIIQQPKI